jgi:hypothetical protein
MNDSEKSCQAIAEAITEPLRREPEPPEYLRPEQAAEILQVCEKTLTRWAKADASFPVLRIAGTTRYPRARLMAWLRQREQGAGRQRSERRMLPLRNGASAKDSS